MLVLRTIKNYIEVLGSGLSSIKVVLKARAHAQVNSKVVYVIELFSSFNVLKIRQKSIILN